MYIHMCIYIYNLHTCTHGYTQASREASDFSSSRRLQGASSTSVWSEKLRTLPAVARLLKQRPYIHRTLFRGSLVLCFGGCTYTTGQQALRKPGLYEQRYYCRLSHGCSLPVCQAVPVPMQRCRRLSVQTTPAERSASRGRACF